MAHKKSGGSSTNGRDSAGRRLGWKCSDGQRVMTGEIIYRQRGTHIYPGKNVKRGRDDTLFALIEGIVKVTRRDNKLFANVIKIL